MKKWMLMLACVPFAALSAHAQESRMDVSASATGLFMRDANGNTVQQSSTIGDGILGSFRYMVTPHASLEANYGWDRNTFRYSSNVNHTRVHDQLQEFSAEYVYSAFNWKNFYPFIEGGIGAYFFGIINDDKTTYDGTLKSDVKIGVPFGGGVAYELSPSWDLRVQYRGFAAKAPDFSAPSNFTSTGRWTAFSEPVIGVAYHF